MAGDAAGRVRGLLVLLVLLVGGCGLVPGPTAEEDGQWVVVFFDTTSFIDAAILDDLLATEMRADEILAEHDAGFIDGNEIGGSEYVLYFAGPDAERIWSLVEPVFEQAPHRWSRVELRSSLEDPDPQVILRSG